MAAEKLHPVDTVVSHPELPEVISPELVLIDPELAQIARRLLRDPPPPPPRVPSRAVPPSRPVAPEVAPTFHPSTASPRPVRHSGRTLAGFVTHMLPMFVVGAVLLGMIASEVRVQLLADPAGLAAPTTTEAARAPAPVLRPHPPAPPPLRPVPGKPVKPLIPPSATPRPVTPAPTTRGTTVALPAAPQPPSPASEPNGKTSVPRPASPPRAPVEPEAVVWVPTKREVEARALALLSLRGPLLPSGLFDERTGLLVNDVDVSCRRVGRTVRFTCAVGAGPSQLQKWELTVVPSRHGAWRWQGPRTH